MSKRTVEKTKHTQKRKPADYLLKTSKEGEIELTEKELNKVTGGAIQLVDSVAGKLDSNKVTTKF